MTMKAVIQLAFTIIGAVVGPFIAVQLSLKQCRSQKWWERQEQIYTQLLTSLSFIKFSLMQDYCRMINLSYYPFNDDDQNRLKQSKHNLQEIRMSGGYIISETTAEAVNEFLRTYDEEWTDLDIHLDKSIDAVDKCIKIIKGEATRALKPASVNFFQQLKTWTDELEPPASNGNEVRTK